MTQSELLKILEQYKNENGEKYGINRMGIFGSFSRDMGTDNSDIDIVVQTDSPDLFHLVHIKDDLEARFHKTVDIIRERETMNPFLKKQIEKDAIYV